MLCENVDMAFENQNQLDNVTEKISLEQANTSTSTPYSQEALHGTINGKNNTKKLNSTFLHM